MSELRELSNEEFEQIAKIQTGSYVLINDNKTAVTVSYLGKTVLSLRAELENAHKVIADYQANMPIEGVGELLDDDNDTLRAENERLREALKWVADSSENPKNRGSHTLLQMCKYLDAVSDIARAALEVKHGS